MYWSEVTFSKSGSFNARRKNKLSNLYYNIGMQVAKCSDTIYLVAGTHDILTGASATTGKELFTIQLSSVVDVPYFGSTVCVEG